MKPSLSSTLLVSLLTLCITSSAAKDSVGAMIPQPPVLEAAAAILMDANSGQIIAQQQPHDQIEPASLTKMMTMYVVDQALHDRRIHLDDLVLISSNARAAPGSRMYVEENSRVKVEDLIKGVIIQSGNDASIALAEHVAGDEKAFVELMNLHAQRIGMRNTTFKNSTGLPEKGHLTTAHDLALLSRALILEFPDSYRFYSEKQFNYNKIEQFNRNRLLWENPFVDGIKTGHTNSAGYCLAASGKKDGMRLISIILGANSDKARSFESMRILSYGFRFFETHRLHQAFEPVGHERVWFGQETSIPVVLEKDLYITIPIGKKQDVKAQLEILNQIQAPIQQGVQLGQLKVYLGDELLTAQGVYAKHSVKKASLASRLTDNIKLTWKKFYEPKQDAVSA